jgi:uncharacterized repeat protein (TIGR03803 family)
MDQAGNLYGGGTSGTVFQLTPNGSGGWNYNVLATCCPYVLGSLVMDHAGNIYGTTYFAEVFELSPTASGPWTLSIPYIFSGGSDGGLASPLIIDAAGNLYGANSGGGASDLGYIFELSPVSGGGWSLTHLHDFSGSDGAEGAGAGGIVPGIIMDSHGDIYGATYFGGASNNGVVFRLHKSAGVWNEFVLHQFTGADGTNPDAPLVMDASGNLFGTTSAGGAYGLGVAFETSRASGRWQTRVLHHFAGLSIDGAYPNAAMLIDPAGNLYGTTAGGGTGNACTVGNANGCGTAFELQPHGNGWKEITLHNFLAQGDGGAPGGIIRDAAGNLYGGALFGGPYSAGVVFELTPPAGK